MKEVCPLTHQRLNIQSIREPGRIISNILGELERYCLHRAEGCHWQGAQSMLDSHIKGCSFRPRDQLLVELKECKNEVEELKRETGELREELRQQLRREEELEDAVFSLNSKLRVYETLLRADRSESLFIN